MENYWDGIQVGGVVQSGEKSFKSHGLMVDVRI